MFNSKKLIYPILLFVVVIISFWQISFMIHPMKFDMIDCAYPWRYFISECIQNHLLPLWNPYQNLGYPIGSDPQSGAWYPMTWIISVLFGYNIYSLHFEFLFHVLFAGLGMFYLAGSLKLDNKVCFFMSVSYMLSGFFIGNAQHLNWIISATWIPFIIASYISLYNKNNLFNALLVALFSFLLLTGGYAGAAIILFYFMLIFFSFFAISIIRQKNYKQLLNFIKYNIIIIIAILLLSSVFLASTYEVLPFLSRAKGLSLKQALFNPFSPQCLISFILPFASVNSNMSYFATDMSMSDIYLGLIPIIFFITSLFTKKPGIYYLFLALGITSLLVALGDFLPFRAFLFNYIPMMNFFRFPSLFRLFTIMFFIILSGFALNIFLNNSENIFRHIKIIALILFLSILSMLVYVVFKWHPELLSFISKQLFTYSKTSHIHQHIFFQGIIQLILLSVFIILIIQIKTKKYLIIYILLLSSFDMFLSSQLNSAYTVYYPEFSAKEVAAFGRSLPKGFPIPINKSIAKNSDTTMHGSGPVWRNLNIFYKNIAYDGFASFKLNHYDLLVDSFPGTLKKIIQNPPVYLTTQNHNNVSIKTVSENHISPDTCYINYFSPERISVISHNKDSSKLNLLQSWYPNWKVYINGKQNTLLISNISLMSVLIPPGYNHIDFKYSSDLINVCFYITSISLILILFLLVFLFLRSKP